MGDLKFARLHAEGRPHRRLPRLSHGQHGRERRRQMADQPRGAGSLRHRLAEQGRGRAEGRQVQGRDRRPSRSRAARATSSSTDDEFIRPGTTYEALAKLRPAFSKDGTVTAGNASGINDGAAALVLMTRRGGREARHHADGAHRLLGDRRRRSRDHGHRPDPASRKALAKAGWTVKDLDLVEANEAFAAQALAGQQGPRLGSRTSSTSTAARSRSAIPSAPRARACW